MFQNWFGNNPSEPVTLIKEAFKSKEVETDFLDLLIPHFVNFDEHNDNNNKRFPSDIKYIAKYTMEEFSSRNSKAVQRIDAYFYIYYRLAQYNTKLPKEKSTFVQDYQKALTEFITKIFIAHDGKHPNILLKDKDLLREINISQHLSSITVTGEQSSTTALTLFKLSIQASMIMNGNEKCVTWKNMLLSLGGIKAYFEDFINQYIKYQNVFQRYPLDLSAYIYLIEQKLSRRNTWKSPFALYFDYSRKLSLDDQAFFDQFATVFDDILRNNQFNISQVNEFLVTLSSIEHLFSTYLTMYASNVLYNQLWLTFLSLSRISDMNSIIQKHLTVVLTRNILSVSFSSFRDYMDAAKTRVQTLREPNRTRFVEIFEKIYDAFIAKEIRNLSKYSERQIRELMNVDPELLPIDRRGKPTNSAIIQQILFRNDQTVVDISQKLKRLFQNISEYSNTILKNSEPAQIIGDETLKDFTIVIPQMWLKIDQDTYRYLCNYHNNNKWTIYIWSKIVNLSVLKVTRDNVSATLEQLDNWMRTVRHDKYNADDILTIIFVQNLFEFLITKNIKSVVSLPNIELIVRFIIGMKDQHGNMVNAKEIDSFIRRGSDELKSILALKGKREKQNKKH